MQQVFADKKTAAQGKNLRTSALYLRHQRTIQSKIKNFKKCLKIN